MGTTPTDRVCLSGSRRRPPVRGASHTGAVLLTDNRHRRLTDLFAADEHVRVEATSRIYQQMIVGYREPNKATGRDQMAQLIESVRHGVPAALSEVTTLGRTLKKRAVDVLAYLDRPGISSGGCQRPPRTPPWLSAGLRNLTNLSPDHSSSPAASDSYYTLDYEEPYNGPENPDWRSAPIWAAVLPVSELALAL
jgi:hypothetical protein